MSVNKYINSTSKQVLDLDPDTEYPYTNILRINDEWWWGSDADMVILDSNTGTTTHITLSHAINKMLRVGAHVWVTVDTDGKVYRINVDTKTATAYTGLHATETFGEIGYDGTDIWLFPDYNQADFDVVQISQLGGLINTHPVTASSAYYEVRYDSTTACFFFLTNDKVNKLNHTTGAVTTSSAFPDSGVGTYQYYWGTGAYASYLYLGTTGQSGSYDAAIIKVAKSNLAFSNTEVWYDTGEPGIGGPYILGFDAEGIVWTSQVYGSPVPDEWNYRNARYDFATDTITELTSIANSAPGQGTPIVSPVDGVCFVNGVGETVDDDDYLCVLDTYAGELTPVRNARPWVYSVGYDIENNLMFYIDEFDYPTLYGVERYLAAATLIPATKRISAFPTTPDSAPQEFTESRISFPYDATVVYDANDASASVAVFTDGCKTVRVRGRERSLVEQIPAANGIADDFDRTYTDGWGTTLASGKWNVRTGADADFSVDPGFGRISVSDLNASRRIAPSSYGYNYTYTDATVKVSADQIAVGDDLYAHFMLGYQDSNNHYLAGLMWRPTANYIMSDNFNVDVAADWGAEDVHGRLWNNGGGADADFSVTGASGKATAAHPSLNTTHRMYLTPSGAQPDGEVLVQVDFDETQTGGSIYGGFLLRYTDSSNNYIVRLRKPYTLDATNGNLELLKRVAGTNTSLVTSSDFSVRVATGVKWWIRARIVGDVIQAKAWRTGDAEPGAWQIDTTDSSLTSGSSWGCYSLASTSVSGPGTPYHVNFYNFSYDNLLDTSDRTFAMLQKREASVVTNLSTSVDVDSPRDADDEFWIRTYWSPSEVKVKVWKDGDTEPADWHLEASDSTFGFGDIGLRVVNNSSYTGTLPVVYSFSDYNVEAQWSNPPTVTHDNYVYVLDEPFDGVVDYDWLRDKITSGSQDVLGVALSYIANASDSYFRTEYTGSEPEVIVDAGTKIAGETDYGPRDSAGARIEGGDWNDYLGVVAHYAAGDDDPEPEQFQCVDCSGFMRTVWGFRFGIPMEIAASDDGVHIPRTSKNIEAYGPGLLLFQSGIVRPTQQQIDMIEIGDVVNFDATSGEDEEEGEIDHDGIYIGMDEDGNRLFISSRKTASGPTFSAIGGSSKFDAVSTNLYSRALRSARRF